MHLDRNFLSKYPIKALLSGQKAKVGAIHKLLKAEQSKLLELQALCGERYKHQIVKKHMTLWRKSGKFPKDNELTKIIFYIGGLPIKDLGLEGTSKSIPKTELKLDNSTNRYYFKYFNERLDKWIELKP